MRRVAIIGSTGSIGRAALDVAAALPGEIEVVGLAAGSNADLLAEQARRFRPLAVAIADARRAGLVRELLSGLAIPVYAGEEGVARVASLDDAGIVLAAIVGVEGLRPTLAAIESGKDVALANKETLVAAGDLVTRRVRERGVRLIPVDSEHAALAEALEGREISAVRRLILTASGGPFLRRSPGDLAAVTVGEALRHPTWRMGEKVTIDSATLMNKALEVIEAHHLFGLPPDRIDVLVHPQSIVHGMVEFTDGTVLAQLAPPDMRLPIQRALVWPKVVPSPFPTLAWTEAVRLEFEPPDPERFPALRLGRAALARGGTAPAILNAANEAAVEAFLRGEIGFTEIARVVGEALEAIPPAAAETLEVVLDADRRARALVAQRLGARR